MVYLLKFGASWVLPPGGFIVLLFLLSLWLWKWRGETRGAAILFLLALGFYLLCTQFIAERTLGWLESYYEPPKNPTGDVIVMLGGGAYSGTPDVDGIGTLAAPPANRLLTAVRLQKKLDIPILLSGGQVYEDTGAEARIGKRILEALGVPEDKILTEDKSINTGQNAMYSADILREKHLTQPILVTSAFHMRRAMLNFKKQGIDAVPYPADYMVSRHRVFHYTKLAPRADALDDNVIAMQEILRAFVTRYFE